MMSQSYTASDIEVLSGLEPVRRRPGMYTDTTRPNHLAHEVIDNSVDEALAGHCKQIDVTLFKDGSLRGRRRRPRHAGRHPSEGEGQRRRADPHAAARGRKVHRQDLQLLRRPARRRRVGRQRAVEAPRSAGCGATARNTTSSFTDGEPHSKLEVVGTVGKRNTGTTVRFWPDPKYFDSDKFSVPQLQARAAAKAVLCPGLQGHASTNEATGEKDEWFYTGDLGEYLTEELGEGRARCRPSRSPASTTVGRRTRSSGRSPGRRTRAQPIAESYVNLIPTTAGRHARQRLALRPRRRGARVLRVPQSAAARRQADARGRLGRR